jgi:hypothetical protein
VSGTEPDTHGRQAFLAWVRVHHPDAGGDPGEFAAGLYRWRAEFAVVADRQGAETTVFRTRGGLWLIERWWQRRQRLLRGIRRVV